jgi:polysaccharide biosynthesis transport protein
MRASNTVSPDNIDPATLWSSIMGALPRLLLWTLGAFALTFGLLSLMAPRFQSEAQMTIDAKVTGNPFSDPKQQAQGGETTTSRMDKEAINTHIRSLQSPSLAAKIVTDLKLTETVEFNSALGDIDAMGKVLRMIGVGGPRPGQTDQDRVIEAYFSRLEVYSARESRQIGVRFTSADPQLAAQVANAVAETYRQQLAGRQVEETKDVQDALSPKIEALTKEVAAADVAVEKFRGQADAFNTGIANQTQSQQQLGELTNELSKLQALRSENEARAKSGQEMLRGGSGEALPDVQKSPLIQNLVQQRVRAERQLAELSATLLSGHPRMQQLNADLAGLKKQITSEVSKIVDGLSKEARVSAERETSVKKRLADLKATVVTAGPDEAKLKMMVADAKSKREELERLQTQFNVNKARADSKVVPVEAKILSVASPSSVPVFPKKMPWAALAALATFILGLAITILKAAAGGARSVGGAPSGGMSSRRNVVEQRLPVGRPAMAAAATAGAMGAAAMAAEPEPEPELQLPHEEPTRDDDGVLRFDRSDRLVAHVVSRTPGRGGYRTLVAGDSDGIDGSQAAVSLVEGLARAGQAVVLVEWSHRDQPVAEGFGSEGLPGIAELVSGAASFEDVIVTVPGSDAHFIPAGHGLGELAATLDPDQLNLVLDALDEAYAHIVVVGDNSSARVLFEVIQGRFDSGILVGDSSVARSVLSDPAGTFLGFEVADIELLRFEEAVEPEPVAVVPTLSQRRLRMFGVGSRAQQPG